MVCSKLSTRLVKLPRLSILASTYYPDRFSLVQQRPPPPPPPPAHSDPLKNKTKQQQNKTTTNKQNKNKNGERRRRVNKHVTFDKDDLVKLIPRNSCVYKLLNCFLPHLDNFKQSAINWLPLYKFTLNLHPSSLP